MTTLHYVLIGGGAGVALAGVVVWIRWRRARRLERQELAWLTQNPPCGGSSGDDELFVVD